MINYTSDDLIQALEKNCCQGEMQESITVRTNNVSIVIECIDGELLAQVYKISIQSINKEKLKEVLDKFWDEESNENMDNLCPDLSKQANRIKVSRERKLKLDELNNL